MAGSFDPAIYLILLHMAHVDFKHLKITVYHQRIYI